MSSIETMTADELLEYDNAGGDPAIFLREVWKRLLKRSLTPKRIHDHFRAKYIQEFTRHLRTFEEGRLFHCTSYGWAEFLQASWESIKADNEAFEYLRGLASLCSMEKSPSFLRVLRFYQVRIMPSYRERRRYCDEEGQIQNPHAMAPENKAKFYRWRDEYLAATRANGWADASGVAYDDRVLTAPNR